MVSFKFSAIFFGLFLVLLAQFQTGHGLFLGHKKALLKHKLWKVKAALLSDYDYPSSVHHYHYSPVYSYGGGGHYDKWNSYSSWWPSYGWNY